MLLGRASGVPMVAVLDALCDAILWSDLVRLTPSAQIQVGV